MLLDIFNDDAFSVVELTTAIDKLPYMPGRIGELGLFKEKPITTPIAAFEEREGVLSLLPTMNRGASPQTTQGHVRRRVRAIPVPHIPHWDVVLSQDLEGKRAFGSNDQVEVFAQVLNDRLARMKQDHEVTLEYHRVGALHGIVLDADGSTPVINLFDEFGVTEQSITLDFDDNGTFADPEPVVDIKLFCQVIYRAMQNALGNTRFTGIRAFCGNGFWDSFISHASVRHAYDRYISENQSYWKKLQIPGGTDAGGFDFGDIIWENYRGGVGSSPFFATNIARFFPTGVDDDVFQDVIAPADFVETVNTRGIPLYAKQERMKWDKGIELHTQSNRLQICTRPKCLIKVTGTNLVVAPTVANGA